MKKYSKSIVKLIPTLIVSLALVGVTSVASLAGDEEGFWLVTPEEGALPQAQPVPVPGDQDGDFTALSAPLPNDGPVIKIEKPGSGSESTSPLEILIHFEPKESAVDTSTVEVTLIKFFNIDITDRVLPYLTSDGIHIKAAELPSGEHTVRLMVKDKDGNTSAKELIVKIM